MDTSDSQAPPAPPTDGGGRRSSAARISTATTTDFTDLYSHYMTPARTDSIPHGYPPSPPLPAAGPRVSSRGAGGRKGTSMSPSSSSTDFPRSPVSSHSSSSASGSAAPNPHSSQALSYIPGSESVLSSVPAGFERPLPAIPSDPTPHVQSPQAQSSQHSHNFTSPGPTSVSPPNSSPNHSSPHLLNGRIPHLQPSQPIIPNVTLAPPLASHVKQVQLLAPAPVEFSTRADSINCTNSLLASPYSRLPPQRRSAGPVPASPQPTPLYEMRRSSVPSSPTVHNPHPPHRVDSEASQFSQGSQQSIVSQTSFGTMQTADVTPRDDITEAESVMGREEINIVGPLVYPAMLSKVGEYLRAKVPLALHMKDSLSYSDCFRGRDAVDTLCYIIKTTDRNLALLLGRALDAQKFFHDVTYNHRLRDSAHELYKFQVHRNITPMGGETPDPSIAADDTGLPNGVFTLLTDCYSPTCTRDRLCYSIACPRRLEQQTRLLNQAHPRMHRSGSRTSLGEKQLKEQLWSSSVPREVVNSVSHKEMKRQEIIFETILTERQFVADLDLVQRIFVEPLRQSNVIDPATIETFIQEVFLNIKQLHSINVRLLRKLLARQCENPIVGQIGDVFMEIVNSLDVYVEYGARQVYAKSIIDQERAINPAFDQFLTDCERLPECRKLPVQSFLARPTTRMGRYPLLLKSILEASPEGHSDRVILPRVIATLKDILHKINKEAGRAENFLKLNQLQSQLVFHPGEQVDLGLLSPSRQLLREGTLILRRNGNEIEVHVFLFDHVLLITKKKKSGVFKVYKRPIPLETFHMVEGLGRRGSGIFSSSVSHKPNPSISSIGHTSVGIKQLASQASRNNAVGTGMEQAVRGYPFTITHLGRAGTSYTLYASNQADRRSWRDAIEKQKLAVTSSKCVFEIKTIMDNAFPNSNKVNSSVSLKEKLIIGTDNGLYVGPVVPTFDVDMSKQFHRVIDLEKIYQVDVLPEYGMLNLLAEKTLYTYPLETLEHISAEDANAASRKGRKVASHVSFFKQGVCDSRTLVSAVRITTLNSTVKVFEPVEAANAKKRGKFGKFLLGESDNLKLFKEFYVPTESSSIDFLRSKICVGCTKGFEIVDLHSLDTQGLLDPSDENLDFVSRRTDLRPISIFRIRDGDFLLCYNEIAFYVDRLGRKSHGDWFINWTGYPVGFSLILPYVIAYEPSFIEVRHVDTGELVQIIPTSNMRPLNTNPDFLHCVDSVGDFQHIFKLRKVQKSPEPGSV